MTLEEAASRFPVDALVRYYPIAGEDRYVIERVRSAPWQLGHGAIVVQITGRTGGVSVDHLQEVQPYQSEEGEEA